MKITARRKRSRRVLHPPSPPQSIADVKQFLADLLLKVPAGKVDHKRAIAAAHLSTALMKAIQVGEMEERLAALEQISHAVAAPGPAAINSNSDSKEISNEVI